MVASSADSSFAIELAYNPIGILILSADSLQTMGMATDAVQQTQWSSIEVTGVSHPILANSRVVPSVLSFDGGIPGTHTSFTNTTSAEWIVASEADGRPIVYSVDQCRIVLAGKRVAFGFDTKDWKYVPVDMEHIMRSNLLWLLDSSNENCTETVTPLETLNVTYDPDDATATAVILSWSWDVSSSGIDCFDQQEFDKWEVEYSRPPFTVWVPLICSENLKLEKPRFAQENSILIMRSISLEIEKHAPCQLLLGHIDTLHQCFPTLQKQESQECRAS